MLTFGERKREKKYRQVKKKKAKKSCRGRGLLWNETRLKTMQKTSGEKKNMHAQNEIQEESTRNAV